MASALRKVAGRPALQHLAAKSPVARSLPVEHWEREFRSQLRRADSFDAFIAEVRAGKHVAKSPNTGPQQIPRAHIQAVQATLVPYLVQLSDSAREAPGRVCVAALHEVRMLFKAHAIVYPHQILNIIKAMKDVSDAKANHDTQRAAESLQRQLPAAHTAAESPADEPHNVESAQSEPPPTIAAKPGSFNGQTPTTPTTPDSSQQWWNVEADPSDGILPEAHHSVSNSTNVTTPGTSDKTASASATSNRPPPRPGM